MTPAVYSRVVYLGGLLLQISRIVRVRDRREIVEGDRCLLLRQQYDGIEEGERQD